MNLHLRQIQNAVTVPWLGVLVMAVLFLSGCDSKAANFS